MKRILVIFVFILLIMSSVALAGGNPHTSATIVVTDTTLTAMGGETGLSQKETMVHIVLSATATGCGGTSILSSEGDFVVSHGGDIYSLMLTSTNCSTVTWTNISVIDTTNGIQLFPRI